MTFWVALGCVAVAMLVWPASSRAERLVFAPRAKGGAASDDPLAVAYTMDLLALALTGGAPGVMALEAVGGANRGIDRDIGTSGIAATGVEPGRHGDVLSRVAAALRWGVDEASAWAVAPPVWRPVANAFELSVRCGAAPSVLLRQAARDLRAAEAERVAVAGAKAGVRIVLPLGLCFLPAFILLTIVPMVLGLIELPT